MLVASFAAGCARPAEQIVATPAADPPDERLAISKVSAGQASHLQNLLRLTERIFSGGEPQGDEAFSELSSLGVDVIVSVDGAKPDVETARGHGLRYVHIPIGYDGISHEAGRSLARVVREAAAAGETLYFHCHHGKHRGPAAAAIACIAAQASDHDAARQILVAAGTSHDYAGLWRDVAAYVPPAGGAELPELVEAATTDSLVAAMSNIDRAFDHLKLLQTNGWTTLPEHPDVVATQEAIVLREGLHESRRTLPEGYDEQFIDWLREAEALAETLERQLKSEDAGAASQTMQALEAACQRCHKRHRN
jgi:hypothetical protein